MSKRILIFSTAYHPFVGGAEIAIKEITDRLGDGFVFDMITLRFDSSLPKFERLGNVNVYRVGYSVKNPVMSDLLKRPLVYNKYLFPVLAACKAFQLHRKNKYDIIWAMMAAFAGFAAMIFKVFNPKVKYLLSLQEGDPIDEIKRKVRFVYPLFKRIFRSADYIQAISNHLVGFAKSMDYAGPVQVVPNAVDIKHFSQNFSEEELAALKKNLGKASDDVFLITTSRLVPKNAIDDIIHSLSFLPSNIKLLVLGDGPDKKELNQLSEKLGLVDRIIWQGYVGHQDIPKYLQVSDIFIRPSLSEGLGNSFLEAMAAGLPVIATPVGGIPDFLFDPEANNGIAPTGLFCEVKNPQSIANQVNRLIKEAGLRENLIKNGKELVKTKYDWEIIAMDMKKIFEKL